ncbi:MAG: ABC transporter ATP-binding protein [Kiritimatiellia bacterium]
MTSIEPASLCLSDISKTYPNGIEALRGVSLELRPGEVFGLVGPNGAGKTTLLKVAAGLLYPETGMVSCSGLDITRQPKKAARLIGLMPDPLGVYTDVSAREYLEFFARLQDIPIHQISGKIDCAVEILGLSPWLDDEVETLSAGWQRRLALGRVLLADTPVLLLDEPAAGLDVYARSELLNTVRRLAETGRAVAVSSHILPELQQLADRFAIINQGRWVDITAGEPFFTRAELDHGFTMAEWCLRCSRPDIAGAVLARLGFSAKSGTGTLIFAAADDAAAARALKAVMDEGVDVYEFYRRQVELNELVLQILRDDNQSSCAANKHGDRK